MSYFLNIRVKLDTRYNEDEIGGVEDVIKELLDNNGETREVIDSIEISCKSEKEIDAEKQQEIQTFLDNVEVTVNSVSLAIGKDYTLDYEG